MSEAGTGEGPMIRRVRWYHLVLPQLLALLLSTLVLTGFAVGYLALGHVPVSRFLVLLVHDFWINNVVLIASDAGLLGLSLWFMSRVTDPALPARFRPLTRQGMLLALGASVAVIVFFGLAEYLSDRFLHTHVGGDTGRLPFTPHQVSQLAPGVAIVALFAPLTEEVYFRGLVMGWFSRHWGPWVGICGSALLFGLLHLKFLVPGWDGWLMTAELVIVGSVLAFVATRTGSLWASLVTHGVNNLCALLMAFAQH